MASTKTPAMKASALVYNEGTEAPIIVYNGVADIADKMIDIARQHDVPVVYEPETAEILALCKAGDCIPVETWKVMAAVFSVIRGEK
ncbi:MAG: EscU/YscU/HrcU family type III secretion system export apparatus switch protein [Spirochaetaceae bacterium]|nr:EscU/YscU/HrcU family type III secretion system export apparatus switch protein [Spirochaetaceae bacterium]MBO4705890.1 EscU/YscU/HrcU family type III secretion system export apparatus switch protein [Spirochaetaceae bacterium]